MLSRLTKSNDRHLKAIAQRKVGHVRRTYKFEVQPLVKQLIVVDGMIQLINLMQTELSRFAGHRD